MFGGRLMFCHKLSFVLIVLYVCFTFYSGYLLLTRSEAIPEPTVPWSQDKNQAADSGVKIHRDDNWNPWGGDFEPEGAHLKKNPSGSQYDRAGDSVRFQVEVWGKAAIGSYFWEHIMSSKLERLPGGMWQSGTKNIGNIRFNYKSGPGLSPQTAPGDVENLVLILNGRSKDKISAAHSWLDYLHNYPRLQHTIIILLGDEQCRNNWITKYMKSRGGRIDAVFIVYDSGLVDDSEFFQWPLGVATYRGFGPIDHHKIDVETSRPYRCNFLGTVYPKSSRKTLQDLLQRRGLEKLCFTKPRQEWLPGETSESLAIYQNALSLSDLTLNPVGMNTECYRLYEAVSFGSVPVVEDKMTPGLCQGPPLKLLKEHRAPFIFINDWAADLPRVLANEAVLSLEDRINRRINILKWYDNFRISMRNKFIDVVVNKCAFND